MSVEIQRVRKHRIQRSAPPARPAALPPPRPLESFPSAGPRCRWPDGCSRPADIWHLRYYCEVHKEEERLAREAALRPWSAPTDKLLAECLYLLKRRARRTLAPVSPQDAPSRSDGYRHTPGGTA